MSMLLPIILAAILSIVFIISNRLSPKTERYHEHILSLGSGMLLAIIFAKVIPALIEKGTSFLSPDTISLSILGGFVGYHLIEKYTYKHVKSSAKLEKELGYLHIGGFFIDNFLAGFILVLLFGLVTLQSYLLFFLFIPFVLETIAISATLRHIAGKFRLGKFGLIFLSLSIFFGAVSGAMMNLQEQNFYLALAIMTGVAIYFITRDELPRGRKGKPALFIIGLATMLALFLMINLMPAF